MTCLVAGALNVDVVGRVERFPGRDESVELADLRLVPGGHAGNCAAALAALGTPTRVVGCVGRDRLADLAVEALGAQGIDVSFVERTSAAMNGIAFAPVLPDGDKALYIARGANVHLSPDAVRAAVEDCAFVVVFDPPERAIPPLAEAMAVRTGVFAPGGLLVSADEAVVAPLLRAAKVLVVNGPESQVMSRLAEPPAAARALAERHGLWAVVTVGAGGCWLARPGEGVHHRPSYRVSVRDATGAGDAFVAGLVTAMAAGAGPLEAAGYACAVGALATRELGAQGSLATHEEVETLRESQRAAGAPTLSRGADGWRARIGHGFTSGSVAELAAACGAELGALRRLDAVLVTHDGREGSAEAAERAAGVLAGLGARVTLTPYLPTPVATHAVARHGFDAALLVTASHNPADSNGVKLKVAPGLPPGAELESAIEGRRREDPRPHPVAPFERLDGAALLDAYRAHLAEIVDADAIRRRSPRVVVDGLHGTAGPLFARVLTAAGCDVFPLGDALDPAFGGLVPDPMRPSARSRAAAAVVSRAADLGLVTDGDGDRLAVLGPDGAFVWPHDVWALILPRAREAEPGGTALATTVATGSILRRQAERLGLRVIERPVGFKHLAPLLASGEAFVGAGGVGDFGLRAHGCDRDPVLAALLLLEVLARAGAGVAGALGDLWAGLGTTAYGETTLAGLGGDLEEAGRRALAAVRLGDGVSDVRRVDGVKLVLDGGQSLLLRPSTTESGVRVSGELIRAGDLDAVFSALRRQAKEGKP